MTRFTEIIQNLRSNRFELIDQARKKKRSSIGKARPAKKVEPPKFDSPELEAIFNNAPDDIKKLLANARKMNMRKK